MSLAVKLQAIRQANGISQEEFADILGVTRQSVSKWERGKGCPETDKLIFISDRFGISLDEMIKGGSGTAAPKRRTISLSKEKVQKTAYPVNSADREILPSAANISLSLKNAAVSEGAYPAQYVNYPAGTDHTDNKAKSGKKMNTAKTALTVFLCSLLLSGAAAFSVLSLRPSAETYPVSTEVVSETSDSSIMYFSGTDSRYRYPVRYIVDMEHPDMLVTDTAGLQSQDFTRAVNPETGITAYIRTSSEKYASMVYRLFDDTYTNWYISPSLILESVDPADYQKYEPVQILYFRNGESISSNRLGFVEKTLFPEEAGEE